MGKKYVGGRNRILNGGINWVGDTVEAVMADLGAYTANYDTDVFLSSVPAAARIHNAVALTGKVAVGGAGDANDIVFVSVPGASPTVEGIILYKRVNDGAAALNPAASPLIVLLDGKFTLTVSEAAAIGATSLRVDPLKMPLATGTVLNFAGGVTATLSAVAAAGARTVLVNALAAAVPLGSQATPQAANSNLPIQPNGGDITFQFDSGPDRIFRV